MTIDWTKPLELLDGTPVVLRSTGFAGGRNPDRDGDYWVVREGGGRFSTGDHAVVCDPSTGEGTSGLAVRNRS